MRAPPSSSQQKKTQEPGTKQSKPLHTAARWSSRAVYENTTWARKLVDNPNALARVADSAEESVSLAMEMATITISDLALL